MNTHFATFCHPVLSHAVTKQHSASSRLAETESGAMDAPQTVIALHCSGADGNQWRPLKVALDPGISRFLRPSISAASLRLAMAARLLRDRRRSRRTLSLVGDSEEKVHLVGHSYGGGVALHAALQRPDRIASLSLYEPTAFHLLRQIGHRGHAAFSEIEQVARKAAERIIIGDSRGAVSQFIDYWNRPDAWGAISPRVQAALIRWAPKIPLDFRALMEVTSPLERYAALTCPTLILRGEHAPAPTRLLAEALARTLPQSRLQVVAGCGHMGPLTHADLVFPSIVSHIAAAAAFTQTSLVAHTC